LGQLLENPASGELVVKGGAQVGEKAADLVEKNTEVTEEQWPPGRPSQWAEVRQVYLHQDRDLG